MAATALLRSIRRRDVVSAPLSVYKSLAGNAQPSWGSSYTGQNYASLCRAFGSKPVVNDILGTGLGNNNTSNVIRKDREQSKATDIAIVGAQWTRSFRALDVGTSKRLFSTISGDIKATQEKPKTKESKELIDKENTADTKIYCIGKSLGEYGEKIPSEVTKEIEDAVADLRSISSRDDLNKIKAKIDAANKALSNIGEHMSCCSGGGSAPGGGTQGGSDQDPEAEYEEVLKNKIVKYLWKVVKWLLMDVLMNVLLNVIVIWTLFAVWRWILWPVWNYKSKHPFDLQPIEIGMGLILVPRTKTDLEVKQLQKEVDELKSKR